MVTTCPKCGGGRFTGPVYCPESVLRSQMRLEAERLAYTCRTCGYVHYEPCLDAKPGLSTDAPFRPVAELTRKAGQQMVERSFEAAAKKVADETLFGVRRTDGPALRSPEGISRPAPDAPCGYCLNSWPLLSTRQNFPAQHAYPNDYRGERVGIGPLCTAVDARSDR